MFEWWKGWGGGCSKDADKVRGAQCTQTHYTSADIVTPATLLRCPPRVSVGRPSASSQSRPPGVLSPMGAHTQMCWEPPNIIQELSQLKRFNWLKSEYFTQILNSKLTISMVRNVLVSKRCLLIILDFKQYNYVFFFFCQLLSFWVENVYPIFTRLLIFRRQILHIYGIIENTIINLIKF